MNITSNKKRPRDDDDDDDNNDTQEILMQPNHKKQKLFELCPWIHLLPIDMWNIIFQFLFEIHPRTTSKRYPKWKLYSRQSIYYNMTIVCKQMSNLIKNDICIPKLSLKNVDSSITLDMSSIPRLLKCLKSGTMMFYKNLEYIPRQLTKLDLGSNSPLNSFIGKICTTKYNNPDWIFPQLTYIRFDFHNTDGLLRSLNRSIFPRLDTIEVYCSTAYNYKYLLTDFIANTGLIYLNNLIIGSSVRSTWLDADDFKFELPDIRPALWNSLKSLKFAKMDIDPIDPLTLVLKLFRILPEKLETFKMPNIGIYDEKQYISEDMEILKYLPKTLKSLSLFEWILAVDKKSWISLPTNLESLRIQNSMGCKMHYNESCMANLCIYKKLKKLYLPSNIWISENQINQLPTTLEKLIIGRVNNFCVLPHIYSKFKNFILNKIKNKETSNIIENIQLIKCMYESGYYPNSKNVNIGLFQSYHGNSLYVSSGSQYGQDPEYELSKKKRLKYWAYNKVIESEIFGLHL